MIFQQTADIRFIPKRIISIVPSQTELLYDLGLDAETIGITKFCVHPGKWFKTKTKVGGTKNLNPDIIHQLQPDLVIANKEENIKEQVEQLALHYPVWLTDVNNLEDALQMIIDIGTITGKETQAHSMINRVKQEFALLKQTVKPVKTTYLIWRKPYMTVGGDTFIHDMLQHCGFQNIFSDKTRYPEVNIAELQAAGCQLLLLSSEPYPFRQKHLEELQSQLPGTKIMLVDGEFFSWYGSRLLKAPGYFQKLKQLIG